MSYKKIIKEIKNIQTSLANSSLASNAPTIKDKSISTKQPIFWEARDYKAIYNKAIKEGSFHVQLQDKSLISFEYTFEKTRKEDLLKHRLIYAPCPYEHEEDDVKQINPNIKNIICPIRIDFDPENKVNTIHPATHLTFLGNQNGRLCIDKPLTPIHFIQLIFRFFYGDQIVSIKEMRSSTPFTSKITPEEYNDIYISIFQSSIKN